jgi:hypothetical protein
MISCTLAKLRRCHSQSGQQGQQKKNYIPPFQIHALLSLLEFFEATHLGYFDPLPDARGWRKLPRASIFRVNFPKLA